KARPTVIFAYTIKGYGLEIAGRPLNHSAQLSGEQIDRLRVAGGLDGATEWDRFPETSAEGQLIAAAAARLRRDPSPPPSRVAVPERLSPRDTAKTSTQAAFGRI